MTEKDFAERAAVILHNMALERTGWRQFFSRWIVPSEPLRNDAARLMTEYGLHLKRPDNAKYVREE